jgi:hypothetical protein
MNELKPWQVILIVAAVLALGFTGWRIMSGPNINQPEGYMTVDVMTGQLYMLQKGRAKGMMFPALHPETGDRTLYPVLKQDGSDTWTLDEGFTVNITEDMIRKSSALTNQTTIAITDEDPIVHVVMP